MDMELAGIYAITNLENGKAYIGSTKDLEKRWDEHRRALLHGDHYNPYLQRSWDKYGEDVFKFMICEYVDNLEQLIEREQYWLDFHRLLIEVYNARMATDRSVFSEETRRRMADASRGRKHSKETRLKMSKAREGKPNGMLGRKHSEESIHKMRVAAENRSEETLRRMSEAQIGNQHRLGCKHSEEDKRNIRKGLRNMSPEAKIARLHKISEANKGYKHSEEAKRNMRIAAKNRPPVSEETGRKISESQRARWARIRKRNG